MHVYANLVSDWPRCAGRIYPQLPRQQYLSKYIYQYQYWLCARIYIFFFFQIQTVEDIWTYGYAPSTHPRIDTPLGGTFFTVVYSGYRGPENQH